MGKYDESLIRDEDLRTELEKARGTFLFDVTARSLIDRQTRRDEEREAAAQRAAELQAMPREQRRRSIIREVIENAPPSPVDVRHIHSVLALCGLPYERQPLEIRRHEKRQGNMSLVVNAGEIMSPTGEWMPQPLPFGPKARLIMMHLCSEAVRQKSATIDIAETFTAFVREMGFSKSGGKKGPLTAFREQINALAACDLKIGTFNGQRAKTSSFKPIDEFEVWLSANPSQRSLWPSTVTFSPLMFESLQRHALPVNAQAVKAFAGSARKLDLYFWLGYRLYNINSPLRISWSALQEQFGQGFARPRAFRAQLAEEIAHIQEVFPKLPLKLTEEGIQLQPADPNILALPAPRARRK